MDFAVRFAQLTTLTRLTFTSFEESGLVLPVLLSMLPWNIAMLSITLDLGLSSFFFVGSYSAFGLTCSARLLLLILLKKFSERSRRWLLFLFAFVVRSTGAAANKLSKAGLLVSGYGSSVFSTDTSAFFSSSYFTSSYFTSSFFSSSFFSSSPLTDSCVSYVFAALRFLTNSLRFPGCLLAFETTSSSAFFVAEA